jgi:hypothetical protein
MARQPELPQGPQLVLGQGRPAVPRRHQFGPQAAQALVQVPWDELRGKQWRLTDALTGDSYDRSGDEIRDADLYVDLGPWQCHLLEARVL